MVYIVMGISGAGKTTVGAALAAALGGVFIEGDDYHSPANKARMRAGIPLCKEDRAPWLEALSRVVSRWAAVKDVCVLSCSALTAEYRRTLLDKTGEKSAVRFIFLHGAASLIRSRIENREDHFMPPGLIDSQLEILEPPMDAISASVAGTPGQIVAKIVREISGR
jgi:gluconokinase